MLTWENTQIQGVSAIMEKLVVSMRLDVLGCAIAGGGGKGRLDSVRATVDCSLSASLEHPPRKANGS